MSASISSKIRHFLAVAAPLIATQFSMIAGSFIALALTGQYSTIDLAGVSIAYNLWTSCFYGLAGVLLGITPIISQLLGANKKEDLPAIIWQALYIGLGFAALLILASLTALDPILTMLGVDSAPKAISIGYMQIMCFAFPAMMLMATFRYALDAHGNTRYSLYTIASSVLITAIASYALINGFGPIPSLGGLGAAIGTAIGYWYMAIVFGLIFTFHRDFKSYHLLTHPRPPIWYLIRDVLSLGIPIGLSIFAEISVFSAAGIVMTQFGTEIVAAHQAGSSFLGLFYAFPLSISMAATIVISYEIGAHRLQDAKLYGWIARGVAVVVALILGGYAFTHLHTVASIYTSDPHMAALMEHFIAYAMVFILIDAIGTPLQGILRAYRDVTSISIIAIGTYWGVTIPVAYVFYEYLGYGPYSIWIGLIVSTATAVFGYLYRLWKVQKHFRPTLNHE